eukprot:6469187-Amphidinium_carterae.1
MIGLEKYKFHLLSPMPQPNTLFLAFTHSPGRPQQCFWCPSPGTRPPETIPIAGAPWIAL